MINEITLKQWSNLLESVAPQSATDPHSLLCSVVENGGKKWEVLTEKEYAIRSKQGFWSNKKCYKLSLTEIIQISQKLINQRTNYSYNGYLHFISYGKDLSPKIVEMISQIDAANWENLNVRLLSEVLDNSKSVSSIAESLSKMTQRSKTQSVWSRVKGYILSYFFRFTDKRQEIAHLKTQISNPKKLERTIIQTIEERIFFNMKKFQSILQDSDEEVKLAEQVDPATVETWVDHWKNDFEYPDDLKDENGKTPVNHLNVIHCLNQIRLRLNLQNVQEEKN